MANNNSFNEAIKAYLDKRAVEDPLFAPKYANPKKSIDECCQYIIGEAFKCSNSFGGSNMKVGRISDEETFSLAVHYYDEEDIKINKLPANSRASVSSPAPAPVELTEEEKKAAREAAIVRLAEEQYQSLKKKAGKKKTDENVQQMSLF